LFNSNVRPAINVGISVSRVGSNAQIKAMKQVAGSLRLDLAQYRALAAFAQFGSELDKSSADQLTRGSRMVELLKQGQYSPVPVEKQVLILYVGTQGNLDDLPLPLVRPFEAELFKFVENAHPGLLPSIREKKALTDEIKGQIEAVVKEFKPKFVKDHEKK
jgi:F-type H+-transporting ATPase subunit alpha